MVPSASRTKYQFRSTCRSPFGCLLLVSFLPNAPRWEASSCFKTWLDVVWIRAHSHAALVEACVAIDAIGSLIFLFSKYQHVLLLPSQVRFAFELFCALQPGTRLMALHGKCKHARRTQIYLDFVRNPGAVLLATDIAARGLDFPSVDWVIQVRNPQHICFCIRWLYERLSFVFWCDVLVRRL